MGDNVEKENETKEIHNSILDKNIKYMLHWTYFYFFRYVIKAIRGVGDEELTLE